MKLLAVLATTTTLVLAFATPIFTTPATAQSQCEPDRNGNVIDLGDGKCGTMTIAPPQTSIETLVANLSQKSSFGEFFQYYHDVVNPAYIQFANSIQSQFFNTGLAILSDRNWVNSRNHFSIVEARMSDVLARYSCNEQGLRDKFKLAFEDDVSFTEHSFITILFMLEGRANFIQHKIENNYLNSLARYLEEDIEPLIALSELKFNCLAERRNMTETDVMEAQTLLEERLSRIDELLQSVY